MKFDMITLSDFIKTITECNEWFRIRSIAEQGYVELHSSSLINFYDNIFIERMFSNNFKYLTIDIAYKFKYCVNSHELINNRGLCEIQLYNYDGRVYIKKAIYCLYCKNDYMKNKILGKSHYYNDSNIKYICFEETIKQINSINARKPFKLKFNVFEHDSVYHQNKKELRNKYECYKFNMVEDYKFKYAITYFNEVNINSYEHKMKLCDFENNLKIISNSLREINSIFTESKEQRKITNFLTKHIYVGPYFKKSKLGVNIEIIKKTIAGKLNINYYKNLFNAITVLKKEYDTIDNSRLKTFRNLIYTISTLQIKAGSYYNFFGKLKNIFPELVNCNVIGHKTDINNIEFLLMFNTNVQNSLELLHYIYSETAEIQLEKLALELMNDQ